MNCLDTTNAVDFKWQESGGNIYAIRKGANGKFYNCHRLQHCAIFTTEFFVQMFPFDVQDLAVIVRPSNRAGKVKFVPLQTEYDVIVLDESWSSITSFNIVHVDAYVTILDVWKTRNYGKPVFDQTGKRKTNWISLMVFKIQIQRKWKTIFNSIIIWMFLLGILSFGIFGYQAREMDGRLGYTITMVLTIVAFQFVIQSKLPEVPYLTLVDRYNLFIFGVICLQS
eukprot:UN08313